MADDLLLKQGFLGIIDIGELLVACLPDAVEQGGCQAIDREYFLAFVPEIDHDKHLPLLSYWEVSKFKLIATPNITTINPATKITKAIRQAGANLNLVSSDQISHL